MNFRASMDGFTKGVTIIVSLVFAVLLTLQFLLNSKIDPVIQLLLGIILLFGYLLCFFLRPLSYELTVDTLIIHRQLKDVLVDRREIVEVRRVSPEELAWTIRTFGVGGLFGYFGQFSNSKLGNMTWYATKSKQNVVLVRIERKKIILTPDDADAFVAQFKSPVT